MWYTYGRGLESQLLHVGYGLFFAIPPNHCFKTKKVIIDPSIVGFFPLNFQTNPESSPTTKTASRSNFWRTNFDGFLMNGLTLKGNPMNDSIVQRMGF